jgi:hypothetical protein
MFKTRILVVLLVIGMASNGQSSHFIAIQSADKKPFYAKIDANVFNSSPTGHLIISRLTEKNYLLTLGISTASVNEVQFSILVSKDIGFILRNTKEKGLVLSNSQTGLAVAPVRQQQYFVSADSTTVLAGSPVAKKTDESFSKLMAEVVNDSAVMENMEVAEEPKNQPAKSNLVKSEMPKTDIPKNEITKNETAHLIARNPDSAYLRNNDKKIGDSLQKRIAVIKTQEKKEKPVQPKTQKSFVKKLSERTTGGALDLVYEDNLNSGKKDTIDIRIPVDSSYITNLSMQFTSDTSDKNKLIAGISEMKPKDRADSASLSPLKTSIPLKDTVKNLLEEKTKMPKEFTMAKGNGIKPDSVAKDSLKNLSAQAPLYRPIVINNNCKNTATSYDVDKLRVKMLAIEDEDDKISTAKKVFKSKCFSTNQITALSEVFTNDAGKYKLFDAAYAYVLDVNNFTGLQSLLKDQYYISRFKAMIRQ